MGGSVRNRHLVKIAGVLGLVLLVVYMLLSWQSDVRTQKDKLDKANIEHNDLLSNFNKLTDELRRNVKIAADTKLDLEMANKRFQQQLMKIEVQVKSSAGEVKVLKSNLQTMEDERARLQNKNDQLEKARQSSTEIIERLTEEFDSLKATSAQETSQLYKCQGDIDGLQTQLLSAQTNGLEAQETLQHCQTQLLVAQEAFGDCQKRLDYIQIDNTNKQAEIQKLKFESVQLNIPNQPSLPNQRQPIVNGLKQRFEDMEIMDDKKLKTLSELRDKIKKGILLSEQEQLAWQMMTKMGNVDLNSPPVKAKIAVDTKPVVTINNQQPAPPQPGQGNDEEQIEDLVLERNKKEGLENLDNKEDEGGADGGDEEDQQDEEPHDNYRGDQFNADINEEREENQDRNFVGKDNNDELNQEGDHPLPDPVRDQNEKLVRNPDNVIDFPDNREEDLVDPDEALRRDREHMQHEWHDRRQAINKDNPQHHREVR